MTRMPSASDLGVTHQSAVDAWECDQMNHLNVRFFGSRFSEAEAYALTLSDLPPQRCADETLHFMREVRCGAALRIESSRQGAAQFLHHLYDGGAERPSATLETRYESYGKSEPCFDGDGWIRTGLRHLGKHCYTEAGELSREVLLGLVNQAAVHLGLDRHRLRDDAGTLLIGSAVVACRIRRFSISSPGEVLIIQSRIAGCGRTSLRLQHQFAGSASPAVLAEIEVTSVFFDMKTRRPCPVPETLRHTLSSDTVLQPSP